MNSNVLSPDIWDDAAARSLIAEYFGVAPAAVIDTAEFVELGADRLDILSLVHRLEKGFALRIPDAQAESCRTVGDLLAAVRGAKPRPREAVAPSAPALPARA